VSHVEPNNHAERATPHADEVIARLAARQHGVVARRQLEAAGLTRHAIGWRLRTGHLHPVHRGVYAAGHTRLSLTAHQHAAVLAVGPRAGLSFRSAAHVHDLWRDGRTYVDVTTPHRARSRPGIRVHQARVEIVEREGLPVTTLERTLLDLASVCDVRTVRKLIERAERLRILDDAKLRALRSDGHRGQRTLRAALGDYDPRHARLRSDLERDVLPVLDALNLPRPELNAMVLGDEVDLWWPEKRLVVELDGFDTHKTRAAFERDRERDRKRLVAGIHTMRVTQRQLEAGARDLAELLR
jgi:hypothetical protein